MLGSLLSRALIMAFGYAYPAYQCYKSVELNKPDIEKLRFWCQYWILVAIVSVVERIGDVIISWFPMYNEAKLAFFIYLWHPKTMGSVYIYNGFFQPYIAQHEAEIDQNLLELRTRATDAVVMFWRQGATYGQTRFFEILQYFASQSQSIRNRTPKKPEQQQEAQKQFNQPPPMVPTRIRYKQQSQQQNQQQEQLQQASSAGTSIKPSILKLQDEHPEQERSQTNRPLRSRTRGISSKEQQPSSTVDSSLTKSQLSETTGDDAPPASHVSASSQAVAGTVNAISENSESSEREATPTESPIASENEDADSNPKEEMMEETIRVTRARLRKNITSRDDPEASL